MYSNVRQRRHWALLQVRNCLGVAAVSITGEVIGGLGSCIFVPVFLQLPNFLSTDLAAARKYFRVTSMWACIDLHPRVISVYDIGFISHKFNDECRCHDAATDHPNEHANRMIW